MFRRVGRPGLIGTVAQISELAKLREARLLSDAEFAAAKSKLLGL